MLSGPAPEEVSEWSAIAMVDGQEHEISSVSFDTAMENDLPPSVKATAGGIGQTSATIQWAPERPADDRPVSPWNPVAAWPPPPGAEVVLWVSDGENSYRRGTWTLDKTTGDARAGFKSKLVDKRDQITGTFTHEALLRHMTPWQPGDDYYRSIGLNFWYPLTMALRSCGFFNVPKVEPYSEVSVPMQGSMWPEAGTISYAQGWDDKVHAIFYRTDYGYAAGSFDVRYVPRMNAPTSDPVQISLVIPPTHSGTAVINVIYGVARNIRLRINTGRTVTAYFSPTGSSPWATVATLSMGSATVLTLLIKGGGWTLRNDEGDQATGTQELGSGELSSIRMDADLDARVAGLQVSHPNSTSREFASLEHVPNMLFTSSGLASTMDMLPAQKGRSISALVDEILTSTLTASWWDEQGRLILVPGDVVRGSEPSADLSDDYDVTSMGWEDAMASVRNGVDVTWQSPSISKGRYRRLELWRGRTQTLDRGSEPLEDWVEPESGIEWFGVDRALRFLDEANWGAYNRRSGSYCGVWYSDEDGDPTSSGDVRIHYSTLYADSLKVTTSVRSLPAGGEANTETHPEATALKAYLRGQPLPVVRGLGRGEWVKDVYSVRGDATYAAVLEHDLMYWGHEYAESFEDGISVAQRLGDFLMRALESPSPEVTGMTVMYDPRRQVGDIYTLTSELYGIRMRLMVTGIKESLSDTGADQQLTVRATSTTATREVTYEDLEAAWDPSDYSGLQAVWAALTYDDLDDDPLEGAPL